MGQASRRKWRKRAIRVYKEGGQCPLLKTLRKQDKLRAVKALIAR